MKKGKFIENREDMSSSWDAQLERLLTSLVDLNRNIESSITENRDEPLVGEQTPIGAKGGLPRGHAAQAGIFFVNTTVGILPPRIHKPI